MIIDFNKPGQSPTHMWGRKGDELIGLRFESFGSIRDHVERCEVDRDSIEKVIFKDEGFGDLRDKRNWATDISAAFDCDVEFVHNGIPQKLNFEVEFVPNRIPLRKRQRP